MTTATRRLAATIAAVEATVAESGPLPPTAQSAIDAYLEARRAELAHMQATEQREHAEHEALLTEAGVTAHGMRQSDMHDSRTVWYVIRRGTVGFWLALERLGISLEGTHCMHPYDCCGRFYASGAMVRATATRILVKQDWYRNV